MRQDEIEVIKAQYGSEKAVIAELEKQYKAAIEAIDEKIAALLGRNDAGLQNVIFQVEHQRALRAQVNAILDQLHNTEFDTISEYLEQAYQDGYIGAMYSLHNQGIPLILPFDQDAAVKAVITDSKLSEPLYQSLGVDISKLKKTIRSEISRGIAAGMSYSEITRNVSRVSKAPISRAKTIVRTEAHRIQEAAEYDGLQGAVKHGAKAYKQWVAILDGKTRSDHRRLDGQIVEVDKHFELGTKKAMYPGDFGDPAEDCNCRCRSLGIAEWELTEKELDRLKKRAEYFGLDKTKDFEDFKQKYLKTLENTGENGIIDEKIASFRSELKSGKIKTVISKQKQSRHIFGTSEFNRHTEKLSKTGDKPSYIREDLDADTLHEIVSGKLGTGTIEVLKDGSVQEFIELEEIVGYYYSKTESKYLSTNVVQVKYALSKGNIHIIPVKKV